MEAALQQIRFRKEKLAKAELKKIIDNPNSELFAKANDLVKHIQEAGSSDLTHYVALRKIVLELLKKLNQDKKITIVVYCFIIYIIYVILLSYVSI